MFGNLAVQLIESEKKYYAECDRINKRIAKAIERVKGKAFLKRLYECIADGCDIKGTWEFCREPEGKYQIENYGRSIPGVWIHQHCSNEAGDSFYGTICIKLRENKFLKLHFEC
jgi:hypothetical protein